MVKPCGKALVDMIAEKAGVSRAAAYAAISPKGPGKIGVGEEKRKLILQLAKEHGYIRNELASSLSTGKTNAIGVCVQSMKDNFFADFFAVLDSKACPKGYSIMISSSEFDVERERRNLKAFISKRVDALILASSELAAVEDGLLEFSRSGGKLVLLDPTPLKGIPNANFDDEGACRMQADFLWGLGHRKAIFAGALDSSDGIRIIHRLRAGRFAKRWEELSGLKPSLASLKSQFYPDPESVASIVEGVRSGRVSAMACASDSLAMGLTASLTAAGIRIPEDLSIVGLDGLEAGANFFVPLSTVRLPTEKLAEEVWGFLERMLFEDWTPMEAVSVVVKPELLERASAARMRKR